jgi:hypothetical protein
MVDVLRAELMDAAAALALPKPRGIIVFGSKGSWLVAAPAVEGERLLAIPPIADVRAALFGDVCEEVDPEVPLVPPVPLEAVELAALSIWFMLTSCPSWLSEIIWPTIAVESTGAVGS